MRPALYVVMNLEFTDTPEMISNLLLNLSCHRHRLPYVFAGYSNPRPQARIFVCDSICRGAIQSKEGCDH